MTHKQIWLQSAKAFLTPLNQRTEHQLELTAFGLCRVITFSGEHLYTHYAFEKLTIAIVKRVYWLSTRRGSLRHKEKFDELRGLMSLFFAAMTLKEFKQLLIEPEK